MPEQQTTHYAAPITSMRDRFLRFIEGDGTETPGSAPAAVVEPPAAPVPGPPAPVEPAPAANVWDDPAAARAEIEKLRRENGAERVNAKTAAAEEARNELLQKLGLTKDGTDKPDPDALAKDLTTAREQARQTAVELAVYRAAAANKANPDALLDSASFLAKVRTLDPNGADFATQVTDAITAAVTSNPILKAARAAGASGVDLGGGTGEQGQLTAAQIARMTPEQIVEADSKGLLRDYMAS